MSFTQNFSRYTVFLILTISLVCLAQGCSRYRDPVITVQAATLGQSSDRAQAVNVEFLLTNPNPKPIELLEVDYEVRLESGASPAYAGKRAALSTLGPRDSRTITLPAVIHHDAPAQSTDGSKSLPNDSISVSGALTYITPGALAETLFDLGVRKPRASFNITIEITNGESLKYPNP